MKSIMLAKGSSVLHRRGDWDNGTIEEGDTRKRHGTVSAVFGVLDEETARSGREDWVEKGRFDAGTLR